MLIFGVLRTAKVKISPLDSEIVALTLQHFLINAADFCSGLSVGQINCLGKNRGLSGLIYADFFRNRKLDRNDVCAAVVGFPAYLHKGNGAGKAIEVGGEKCGIKADLEHDFSVFKNIIGHKCRYVAVYLLYFLVLRTAHKAEGFVVDCHSTRNGIFAVCPVNGVAVIKIVGLRPH